MKSTSLLKSTSLSLIIASTLAYFAQPCSAAEVDEQFNPGGRGTVDAIAAAPEGGIVVGGEFDQVGGVARGNLARIGVDGAVDANFGVVADGAVFALARGADGAVYGGGAFNVPSRH